jgi:hypothetical protein
VAWKRDMTADLSRLRDFFNVTTVVCLLNDYELRVSLLLSYILPTTRTSRASSR